MTLHSRLTWTDLTADEHWVLNTLRHTSDAQVYFQITMLRWWHTSEGLCACKDRPVSTASLTLRRMQCLDPRRCLPAAFPSQAAVANLPASA